MDNWARKSAQNDAPPRRQPVSRLCAFTLLIFFSVSWAFLSWQRRVGRAAAPFDTSTYAGPFDGDEHPSGMPTPSLPFLLWETERPKP